MSTYYIKQKLVKTNEYVIYDFYNQPYVKVKSNYILTDINRLLCGILSIGYTLYAKRMDGSEFVTIKKKSGFFETRHFVYINGEEVAVIKQHNILFLKPKIDITIKDKNYSVTGDIMGIEFEIKSNGGACAAQVKKERFKMTDRYKIDIFEGDKDELFVSAAIVIDNLFHN